MSDSNSINTSITLEDMQLKKKLWNEFYALEESFLAWLNNHAIVILDINASSPMFTKEGESAAFGYDYFTNASGKRLSRPPRYVRKCITFSSMELFEECQEKASLIEEKYREAAIFLKKDKSKLRFPQRFPLFFSNVEQINHSSDNAFSSKLISLRERFVLFSGLIDQDMAADIVSAFKKAGFSSLHVDYEPLTMEITVDGIELYRYFDCSEGSVLRCRRHTGTQYTVRILFGDAQRAVRSKFGLIVIDPESTPSFYKSPPRKKRSDTIELSSREVFLPYPFANRFFVTNN